MVHRYRYVVIHYIISAILHILYLTVLLNSGFISWDNIFGESLALAYFANKKIRVLYIFLLGAGFE